MHYTDNSILRYINKPAKIIFWDIEDAVFFFIPFAIFALIGKVVSGFIFGAIVFKCFKLARRHFGCVYHVAYWYLPTTRLYNIHIPSYVRKYIG